MDREAMAKRLREVDRACYKGLIPDAVLEAVSNASPVGNAAYLAMADAALAECAKAAEEGYREGFLRSTAGGCSRADLESFELPAKWQDSCTRAKWEATK